MIYFLDLFGVLVFALTGSLAAGKKKLDLFGVIVVAGATAVGGGTLRDLILGSPVFWVDDNTYIYVVVATALLTVLLWRKDRSVRLILPTADALGLAVFTVIGAQKALALQTSATVAVIMGVMTGVVGGMIRDIFVGEIPLILRREIYATASLGGAIVFVLLTRYPLFEDIASFITICLIFAFRLAAIRRQLSLPVFSAGDDNDS